MNATTRGQQNRSEWVRRAGSGATFCTITKVTTTGTSAALAAANNARKSIMFYNNNGTTTACWIQAAATATANSASQELRPKSALTFTFTGAFTVIDDGSNHTDVTISEETF